MSRVNEQSEPVSHMKLKSPSFVCQRPLVSQIVSCFCWSIRLSICCGFWTSSRPKRCGFLDCLDWSIQSHWPQCWIEPLWPASRGLIDSPGHLCWASRTAGSRTRLAGCSHQHIQDQRGARSTRILQWLVPMQSLGFQYFKSQLISAGSPSH